MTNFCRGGLVRSYYKLRYQLLFTMAEDSLTKGYQWSQSTYTARLLLEARLFKIVSLLFVFYRLKFALILLLGFDEIRTDCGQVELPWQTDTTTFPVEPEADPIATSKAMIKKYLHRDTISDPFSGPFSDSFSARFWA